MPWKPSLVETQRFELIKVLLLQREEVGAVCKRFGVSRQTGYKFLRRFKSEGKLGLRDQTRRPRKIDQAQSSDWRQRVIRLRRAHPTWGSRKLRWLLERRFGGCGKTLPSERTVQRWVASAGLARRTMVRRRARPVAQVQCRRARRSNDVWTFDLKGWFCTGRWVEDRTSDPRLVVAIRLMGPSAGATQ